MADGSVDDGLDAGLGGTFRRLAAKGFGGGGGDSEEGGGGGGRAPGGLGAAGGFGAGAEGGLVVSPRYGESLLAPVSTPPRLRNLGIPAAKSPPSWGAAGTAALLSGPEAPSLLLLRSLFPSCAEGTGGANPVGGFAIPGIGGAPAGAGPVFPPPPFEINGADLSFVTAFFKRVPLLISERRAPY